MSPNRKWILYIAGVFCIILAVIGGISYPLTEEQGLLDQIIYTVGISIGAFLILLLVYFRGLPDEPTEEQASS
ncbi:MAG: hypothetical protein RTU30_11500 [Candidatus Thorarchaeota archaeon]